MKTSLLGALVSVILFGSNSISPAQSSSPDAQLKGTLLDASGAGVGGVQIVAQLAKDRQSHLWKASSTTDGAYTLTLPPGNYHVVFQRKPFVNREFDLALTSPGETRTLDLRLDLERLSSSVVVTAQAQPLQIQQTTAPVDVITRDDIDARLSVTLPDVLLTSPGVAIGRTGPTGGSASVFLNGGNSAFTKVLVDGTPVNEPGNAVDFANFTLDNIDKVEVVRGAESAIYGSDAVSGVIQVFTHRGTTRIPEVLVFAEGGNFDTGRGGAQLSGLLGNFDYSGAASYFSSNGPQDQNVFLNRTLSGNFGYRLGEENQLRLTLRNNTSNAQTPGQTLLEPASPDSHTDYHFFSSNARWDFATGKHWHHQLMAAESYNRQFTANPMQSFFPTNDPFGFCPQTNPSAIATAQFCDFTDPGSHYRYNRASLNAQSSYLLENFAATAGYQYEVENAGIPSTALGHVRRNNQAGFLDFRYSPHPRASLNFGARAEANGYFGTRVVPRAGASLALLQGRGFWGETRLRAFYGQGIKEPRFDQIFDDRFGDLGNPNLKPESSKTWTIGLDQKLAGDRVRFTAEYFSSRFYNMISFAFCDGSNNFCDLPGIGPIFGFGYFFNTDRARARGTNITAEGRANRWLRVRGNYTYDDSLILVAANPFDPTQLPGNRLARRPVNSGSLTALATWRSFGVTASGYFSGQRTDSDFLGLDLTRTPGYARFDLATTYQITHGVSAYLRTSNLFDKSYQDALGYPALGREFRIGMNYRFGGKT
ncbi:MAG TPA: TonB-dependent receptor [Candidatus Eisenbacteria bacterium]|nr:TonB-dependent receptor [Candidatus Eisenbacteria bacterium]